MRTSGSIRHGLTQVVRRAPRILAGLAAWHLLGGCAYIGGTLRQAGYSLQQRHAPEQRVFKHMLSRENFYVFGTLRSEVPLNRDAVAIVAVSNRFGADEVVDVNHFTRVDSFYGLHLPDGDYRLLVVSDLNRDGNYDETEILGGRDLTLRSAEFPDRVRGGVDIELTATRPAATGPFRISVQKATARIESLYYPKGTLRSLDDPIFSPAMAELGMYHPAAFLERAPMMFYALEEDVGYKVPVVFVHGIGGSARDFEEIVRHLDRKLYRPWFFHYASGRELSQLSEMFYRIFLSGKVIPLEEMPLVIVAHSMGGLVVRDALNRCTGRATENKVARLVTIASPLGGHPGAKNAAAAPLILPSWRDLNPDSPFIRGLHRRPLPPGLRYDLLYAFGDERSVKLGENSDGVVPLSSQLAPAAQREATAQFGFNNTHTGILRDPKVSDHLIQAIAAVKAPLPDDHMRLLLSGGYSMPLGPQYAPEAKHVIATIGLYLEALAAGTVTPIHPFQVHFIQACRGEKSPTNDIERGWLRFIQEFPNRRPPP